MSIDFTFLKYEELCQAVCRSNYQPMTVLDFIELKDNSSDPRYIVFRHDIDRSPNKALVFAKIESRYGIRSSYYFRVPGTFVPEIIKKIKSLGHEIGLHYESLDKARGDISWVKKSLSKDLNTLRTVAEVKTASMHGNPLSLFDNRDIWSKYSLEEFGLGGEAYLTVDFKKVLYYSDTGRTWGETPFNIKDHIPRDAETILNPPCLKTTDDLINFIKKGNGQSLYLLAHPCRWAHNVLEACWITIVDAVLNSGKILYQKVKGKKK